MYKLKVVKLSIKEKQALWLKIGQNMARIRGRKSLTQEALAAKAGVSLFYVGFIERGEKGATTAILAAVARALGVKLSDLFKGI